MYLHKIILNLCAAFVFLSFVFIKNAVCDSNKNNDDQPSNKNNDDNPWKDYIKLYEIPDNHGSGVFNDLGGSATYLGNISIPFLNSTTKKYFRFPVGKCPVFGKTINLPSGSPFFNNTLLYADFNETEFLDLLLTGDVPGEETDVGVTGLNWPPAMGSYIPKFKGLNSPVEKSSIYECAQYAKNFVQNPDEKGTTSCTSSGNDKCLQHPFAYFMKTKKCYILFNLWQHKRDRTNATLVAYNPVKSSSNSYVVFGTSMIEENWEKKCPMKPIKGVAFGTWNNNVCNKFTTEQSSSDFDTCVTTLFNKSPDDGYSLAGGERIYTITNATSGIGYNWANFITDKCYLSNSKPDCIVYEKEGYAITSVDMGNSNIYNLPPCFNASAGWVIEASCGKLINRTFTCTDGEWVANTGEKIRTCLTAEKLTPSIRKNNTDPHSNSGVKLWASEGIVVSSIVLFISLFLI